MVAPLYDGCPHCDARFGVPMLSGAKLKKPRVPAGVTPRLIHDLRRCWKCFGDLATLTFPLELLPPDIEKLPRQFSAGCKVNQPVWAAFVRGLRAYLGTYDLAQLIESGQVVIRRLPRPEVNSSVTAQARFRTERVMAWLLTPMAGRVLHPHQQTQLMTGAVVGLLSATIRPDSARRWLHVAWLGTRVLQDKPLTLVKHWPDQVSALVSLFEERCADPRPEPDPAFQLHDEPWQMMAPFLADELAVRPSFHHTAITMTLTEKRTTMNAVLQNFAGTPFKREGSSRMELARWELRTAQWQADGRLGLALSQLHRAVLNYRLRLLRKRTGEPDWVASTVAVLMTDRCIEFARTVNPSLHQDLFLELIRALEHKKR